jgi:hypothetical protein
MATTKLKYDRESTLRLLQQRSWKVLIELFKDNTVNQEIQKDEIAKGILDRAFIQELIGGSSFEQDPDHLFYLEQFHILHSLPTFDFKLTENEANSIVEKIIYLYKDTNFDTALSYAKRYPNISVSIEVLKDFEKLQPIQLQHSQSRTIHVTQNSEIEQMDGTTSLFKSAQEYHFYKAVREVYHSYLVFPNVAVSAIVNYEQIKHQLTQDERSYFFKALIDCVVIDSENDFKPFKMLEIDSIYHDGVEQKNRDLMKDKIMSKAGQKLVRIRVNGNLLEQDLRKLILEVLR